jgi:hypothetical protein
MDEKNDLLDLINDNMKVLKNNIFNYFQTKYNITKPDFKKQINKNLKYLENTIVKEEYDTFLREVNMYNGHDSLKFFFDYIYLFFEINFNFINQLKFILKISNNNNIKTKINGFISRLQKLLEYSSKDINFKSKITK